MESGGELESFYHRIESPTQPQNIVSVQERTGVIRGYPALGSLIPKVKAYSGRLPEGVRGIEFTTVIPIDAGCAPGYPTWSGRRPGIRHGVDEDGRDFVEISVVITQHTQT